MWKKAWRCCAATLASQIWTRITVLKTETISVAASGDIVAVRHAVRRQAVKINLSLVDQTKIVTAASELARNMLIYGGGGEVTLEVLQEGVRHGLRVHFVDDGPGIPDIDLALRRRIHLGTWNGTRSRRRQAP